jgi:inositol transport system substrate-binding protein
MKKALILLLSLLLIFSLASCGGGNGENEDNGATKTTESTGTVGFAQCNLNDTFQTLIVDAAQAKADELGYKLDVQDAQEDVIKQQDQVNAMVEQGCAAILVVPVDTSAMAPITEAVTAAGIPLVYINRNPFGEDTPPEGVYYIGSQEIVAGQLQGEYLVEKMGETGGVGILMGILSNEGAVKRTEGNKEVLEKYSGIDILAEEAGDWQADKGMSITENWMTAYGDKLNAILANNDEMAKGALQALEASGRTDVLVLGVDATEDAKKLVKDGKMAATVLQDANGQGGKGLEVADKAIKGEAQDAITWIDFVLITPDNIDDYL